MFELPLLNTVILLSSGATITYAHHSLIHGERKGALYGSIATVLLAIIFTIFQGIEYNVSSFTISDGAFGTCFFFGTGFHGFNCIFNKVINRHSSSSYSSRLYSNKRFYSTISVERKTLSPYWVTGFSDAESSFSLKVSKKSTAKSGWHVIPEFRIELHNRDSFLLREIHAFFGVGNIIEIEKSNRIIYSVQSRLDLINVIIPHFDQYPLITQKKADYLLFKQAVAMLNLNIQSDISGIQDIMRLKAAMNWGLSAKLKSEFLDVIPTERPLINSETMFDPNWLAGFVDGEGCFYVNTKKSKSYVAGYQVIMSFSIYQHIRDELLLRKFMDYFNCGNIEKVSTRPDEVKFIVYKFSDIRDKIIPFFQNYPLHGIKSKDFKDFCEIAKLMENKLHLTIDGIKKIKSLKSGMNRGRM